MLIRTYRRTCATLPCSVWPSVSVCIPSFPGNFFANPFIPRFSTHGHQPANKLIGQSPPTTNKLKCSVNYCVFSLNLKVQFEIYPIGSVEFCLLAMLPDKHALLEVPLGHPTLHLLRVVGSEYLLVAILLFPLVLPH